MILPFLKIHGNCNKSSFQLVPVILVPFRIYPNVLDLCMRLHKLRFTFRTFLRNRLSRKTFGNNFKKRNISLCNCIHVVSLLCDPPNTWHEWNKTFHCFLITPAFNHEDDTDLVSWWGSDFYIYFKIRGSWLMGSETLACNWRGLKSIHFISFIQPNGLLRNRILIVHRQTPAWEHLMTHTLQHRLTPTLENRLIQQWLILILGMKLLMLMLGRTSVAIEIMFWPKKYIDHGVIPLSGSLALICMNFSVLLLNTSLCCTWRRTSLCQKLTVTFWPSFQYLTSWRPIGWMKFLRTLPSLLYISYMYI